MTKINTKKIAVFGSLTIDLFVQPSESQVITMTTENSEKTLFALPHGGKISAEHIQEHFGGGASNVGVSFSRLGNEVFAFGGIGNDNNGKKILEHLEEEKISGTFVQAFENIKSGFSLILNAFDGERTVIFTSEANQKFNTINSPLSLGEGLGVRDNFDAIYLCHLSGKNPEKIFSEIQKFLEKTQKKLFWNPGRERITLGLENPINKNLLKNCDILFVNTEEAEEFSGISAKKQKSHGQELREKHHVTKQHTEISIPDYVRDVSEIAEKFLESGVTMVVITDGRKGAQAFSQTTSEYLFIPCVSSTRVDTLGAGDSFASAFSHFYMQGETLQKCGEYASINAASVVSYRGAQDGLLTKTQILR